MSEITDLRNEMMLMFGKMDQRFDGIDRRLDGMDQRFDGIDRRLDGMNQRLDKIDKNLREGFLDLSNTIGIALKDHEERLDSIENCMKNVSLMLQTRPETSSNFKNSMLL